VLIHEEGRLQLCDFGVATVMETKLDKRRTFIGTLHWMPPELWDQKPEYSDEVRPEFYDSAPFYHSYKALPSLTPGRSMFGLLGAQSMSAPWANRRILICENLSSLKAACAV
jgi:serine/threonine protein kinase